MDVLQGLVRSSKGLGRFCNRSQKVFIWTTRSKEQETKRHCDMGVLNIGPAGYYCMHGMCWARLSCTMIVNVQL